MVWVVEDHNSVLVFRNVELLVGGTIRDCFRSDDDGDDDAHDVVVEVVEEVDHIQLELSVVRILQELHILDEVVVEVEVCLVVVEDILQLLVVHILEQAIECLEQEDHKYLTEPHVDRLLAEIC